MLEAAYDDAAGVTAAFNLNLLHRLNRELGADFDVSAFRHRAVWNAEEERVEMHLESTRAQRVHLGGQGDPLPRRARPSTPRTATNTAPSGWKRWPTAAGWDAREMWTDPGRLFSVWLLDAR